MQEKRMVQETFFCLKFMKFKEPYYINNSILQVNLLLETRFGKNNSKNIPLSTAKTCLLRKLLFHLPLSTGTSSIYLISVFDKTADPC